MNYRWMLMGIGIILIGLFLTLLYKIPFSWVISILGFILFFFGYAIKGADLP